MAISITEGFITLHSQNTTYQMGINPNKHLVHLYYGKKLDDSTAETYSYLGMHSFSPFPYDCDKAELSQDTVPMEYPVSGSGDFRTPALTARMPDGSCVCELRYESAKILESKPKLCGLPSMYDNGAESETVEITLKDTVYDFKVYLYYTVFEKYDIITRSARIENLTDSTIELESALSICLDMYRGDYDLISFYGRHIMERNVERTPIGNNKIVCESRRGASSHQKNPSVILCDHTCTEEYGECTGITFVYSSNFMISAEMTQIDTTRLVAGINPEGFKWLLKKGESFTAPEVIMSYSSEGLGKLSQNFHKAVRNNICRGKFRNSARPILINNWEATYFNFDADKLIKIAERAKAIGVDTLVMDDGWFIGRANDRSSLGDWFVDEQKLGCTLADLISRINGLGMKFGIWFEPECISEKSKLYAEHPDWCIKVPGRDAALSRWQWVLNMGNPDAVDAVFEMMSNILDKCPINYLKWDFNRHISDVYSSCLDREHQGETNHRFMLGVYDLLERLNTRYPDMLIEGCSGGGGRFDCGMLHYSPQIWTSDNSDPMCRTHIQYGTSFFFPVSTMGAHVTASPNHQSNRVTTFHTRSSVAMAGTYGFELDLTKVSDEDIEFLAQETEFYKVHSALIREGDYFRLSSPNDIIVGWEFVSQDKSEALVTTVKTKTYVNSKPIIVKPRGLDPDRRYRIISDGDEVGTMSGCALMNIGLKVSYRIKEYTSNRFELIAL